MVEAAWRIESAKVIAGLTRIVGDIGAAEDLAQDALLAALEQWPRDGVPRNPGAWLTGTAKHRAFDLLRRRAMAERTHAELARGLERERGINRISRLARPTLTLTLTLTPTSTSTSTRSSTTSPSTST